MKFTALVLALLLAATGAYAQFNGCPPGFCPGLSGGGSIPVPPLTNLRITNTGDFRITNTTDNRAVSP